MSEEVLYLTVYKYYRNLIETGVLPEGSRMPSIRRVCRERGISKTTAENAYFQLVADGYIISRERSGYFVSPFSRASFPRPTASPPSSSPLAAPHTYAHHLLDFSRVGEDATAFCSELWQKYMKSAMRDIETLVSYGEPQGETSLREELAQYVRTRRNIYCTADSIVIGASTQSLLMLLLALLKRTGLRTASVPAVSFSRYAQVFSDFDFEVGYRNKDADVIYVSPAHMTAWGEVMTLTRRYELLEHSRKGHLIIEDDYLNDFNYSKQACPSIYGLSGGEHVVYLGAFSRVLLPSIRISYMILPKELLPLYKSTAALYDQTASKTEQLSLCRFLRDHQLERHIRRIRRLYGSKRELLKEILEEACEREQTLAKCAVITPLFGDSGTEFAVRVRDADEKTIRTRMSELDILCRIVPEASDQHLLIFSCGTIEIRELEAVRRRLTPS